MLPIDELRSIGPRSLKKSAGLPHPLAKFGIAGEFVDGLCADIILYFIDATVSEEPNSQQYNAATWFLLASERTYFYVCAEAGIEAVKLRDHLSLVLIDVAEGRTGVIHHLDRSKDVTKAVRVLRKQGVPVSFPMHTVNGDTIFAIGKDFMVTADQILELLDGGELHAEGVRRLAQTQASATLLRSFLTRHS